MGRNRLEKGGWDMPSKRAEGGTGWGQGSQAGQLVTEDQTPPESSSLTWL